MKIIISVIFSLLSVLALSAQTKLPPVDKSSMDVSYYPDGYPLLKLQDKSPLPIQARVIYSRPQKNDRVIFGELIEYGKVWRLGANEATELEFYQNVKINNVKIKKGRYSLFAIPNADKWTFILNKETDTWGSFRYDEKTDVVRINVPEQKLTEVKEEFVMTFEKSDTGANLDIAWEDVQIVLPILF